MDQRVEPFLLLGAEFDDVFLYGRLFRGQDSSPAFPESIDSEIIRRINDAGH